MKEKGITINIMLLILLVLVILSAGLLFDNSVAAVTGEDRLDLFAEEAISGGPPPDGIPPIEDPDYISMEDAEMELANSSVVFVFEAEDDVFIYPQNILVWHEIVNEEIDGEKMIITYCPLTGSALGFKGNTSAGETTMGTSGNLVNSNLIMFDRNTNSYWPQILGQSIEGELKGERLEEFPLIWTTWELAKDYYNEAKVLSRDTGFARDYDRDPYGSYAQSDNYYDSGGPLFPVMESDDQFPDKKVVMAGRFNEIPFAFSKNLIAEEQVINLEVDGESLVAIYDGKLDTARVFRQEGSDSEFIYDSDSDEVRDQATETVWNARGLAVTGELEDTQLEQVNVFDVMWFAWYAFYPESMDNFYY